MNNILNLAGHLAKVEDFEFSLTLPWTIKAIRYCTIPDPEISDKLYRSFGIDPDDDPVHLYGEDLWNRVLRHGARVKEFIDADVSTWDNMEITPELAEKFLVLKENEINYRTAVISSLGESGYSNLITVKTLKKELRSKVLDQEQAIEVVGDTLVKAFYKPSKKYPKAVLLFLGPPATGKTLLAEEIAAHLGDIGNFLRLDMTRYTHEQESNSLFGTDKMWGNAQPGTLTSFVREHPNAILVFDEFEKAHSKVQTRFLSILNDGYAEDACGWCSDEKPFNKDRTDDEQCQGNQLENKIDFSNTIMIFTSNLGSEVYSDTSFTQLFKEDPDESEKIMFDALLRETKIEDSHIVKAIRPEFLSRLRQGRLILFNALSYDTLSHIAQTNLIAESIKFRNAFVCETRFENIENIVQALLLTSAPSFDVRGINSHTASLLFDPIADYLMLHENIIKTISISVSDQLTKELSAIVPEDKEHFKRDLFRKNMSYDIEVKIEHKEFDLEVIIDSISGKQIKRAVDYAEGGISAELPEITFEDIAGHTKTKENLIEISNILKSYKKLKSMGIKIPKGMLLFGPPGTGKTMLAKAFAAQSGLPFISTTGKNMLNEEYMKKVFETAKLYAPSIIFIDEMDAIRKRGSSAQNDSVYDKITNQMLTYIDGFETSQSDPVFIIAATNNQDMIDPAILRSGRIDMHVEIGILDREARTYLIDRMLQKDHFSDNIDKEKIILLTTGMSGADLEMLDRECSLESIRRQEDKVSEEIIIERINISLHGEKSPIKRRDEHLTETAYHEAGHAIVSKHLMPEKMIQQVTITPRGGANGFVAFAPDEMRQIKNTKSVIQNLMAMALAGRIAQIIKFGADNIDSGASSDLEYANSLAYDAITNLGMDSRLENVRINILGIKHEGLFDQDIEMAIKEWVADAGVRSREVLEKNWDVVEKLAQTLLKQDTIYGDKLDAILKIKAKKSRTIK